MNPHKILIIQTAFLGDVILCTPLIRVVREKYHHSKICFLVIPQTKGLLRNNPYLNQILAYDKKGKEKGFFSFLKLVKEIKSERFDLAYVPHRSFRSSLLTYLAGIPRRVGFDKNAGAFLLTDKIRYVQNQPEAKRNLSLLGNKSLNKSELLPELFPSKDDFKYVEELFKLWKVEDISKIAGIAPGSVWKTKRWLPHRFGKVADLIIEKLGLSVVFLGGREDKGLCLDISREMKNESFIAAGETSPLQSAALISRCKVILSNDTAPMHIGVAMRVPVIAIFGSTIPEFGFAPNGDKDIVIQKDVYCRPCGIHGRKKCPEKHFRCMKEITAEEVFEAIALRV